MKTQIIKVKGDWMEVVNDCRSTVRKQPLGKEPSSQFKRAILIAEHSPIRDIIFKWKWELWSWIATHFSRHKWECFISTQRSDRTGVNRNELRQDEIVTFTGEANVQHLIDTMRKRLCYQAAQETREYAEDLRAAITESDADIGMVLVPNCIYRAGCPEIQCCGHYQRFTEYCRYRGVEPQTIYRRYELYNDFMRSMNGKNN